MEPFYARRIIARAAIATILSKNVVIMVAVPAAMNLSKI